MWFTMKPSFSGNHKVSCLERSDCEVTVSWLKFEITSQSKIAHAVPLQKKVSFAAGFISFARGCFDYYRAQRATSNAAPMLETNAITHNENP